LRLPESHAVLCGYLRDELIAGQVAMAAGISADAAVLHAVRGMSLALLSAEPTGGGAGLEGGGDHLRIEGRLPGDDAAGRVAEIGAVEIEPDTARERFRVRFGEAGVGTGGAGLGAVETGTNAGQQRVVAENRLRMRLDHGSGETHGIDSKSD
jgi:hypothetical protein